MMDFLVWLENTRASLFMREDFYAYFVALIFHAWGMAFLVGGGVALSLRVLGVGKGARLEKFGFLFPVMWFGAAMAVLSGIALLLGYPAKALTNWIFPLKLVLLVSAALLARRMAREAFPLAERGEPIPAKSRWQAAGVIALFAAGVAAGKLLLYTNVILMASYETGAGYE